MELQTEALLPTLLTYDTQTVTLQRNCECFAFTRQSGAGFTNLCVVGTETAIDTEPTTSLKSDTWAATLSAAQ